jgi:enamine deaminase RidA (YjgF/YER057c/UK114 family)
MSLPSERLSKLGLVLPAVVTPLAAYVPAVRIGDLVFTAGQLPMVENVLGTAGKVGAEVSVAEAVGCARIAALNALAAVVDAIVRVVKLTVFVASAPDFGGQAEVANGASTVLGEVFGDAGRHARSAVGVAVLPFDAPVEVEMVVAVGANPQVHWA